ncbi:MAG: DcrB-related protein [Akkermansiaceae bacterium]|nr:DcrB-related protein [Akkermansiaceae bacterium]
MKPFYCFLTVMLTVVGLVSAEKVTFDTKYSVEFPEGWKKSANPRKDALVYRETEAGDASFAIAKLELPENAKADLKATLKSMIDGFKQGMTVLEEPKMTEGAVDGKQAQFARVFVKAGEHKLDFFLVAVDGVDRVFIMQATLPASASEKSRNDCMKVIQSFEESR